MPSPTPVDQVLLLVDLLNRDMSHSFARDGLTQARAHLLWVLAAGPSTQKDLAVALAVTPRNITGLVDGLVASGHVVRRPHPTDRRATHVALTGAGSELVARMVAGYEELAQVLFGGLTERQLGAFTKTLDQINQRLQQRLEQEGV